MRQTLPAVCIAAGISTHPGIRCESAEPVFSQVKADFRLSGTFTSLKFKPRTDSSHLDGFGIIRSSTQTNLHGVWSGEPS